MSAYLDHIRRHAERIIRRTPFRYQYAGINPAEIDEIADELLRAARVTGVWVHLPEHLVELRMARSFRS